MSVHKYWEKFTPLLKYMPPYQQDNNLKVRKFIMGLNNRIGGAIDVLAPRTMEEALEKAVRQEHKIKKDDSIWDNKRKTTWNSEGADFEPQKKQFKDYKYNKLEYILKSIFPTMKYDWLEIIAGARTRDDRGKTT